MSFSTPEEERPLSSKEQILWKKAKIDYWWSEQLDLTEQAARDCRVVGALRVMVLGTTEYYKYDFEELSYQIGGEYGLGPDEIMTAFDIAEDRILHE